MARGPGGLDHNLPSLRAGHDDPASSIDWCLVRVLRPRPDRARRRDVRLRSAHVRGPRRALRGFGSRPERAGQSFGCRRSKYGVIVTRAKGVYCVLWRTQESGARPRTTLATCSASGPEVLPTIVRLNSRILSTWAWVKKNWGAGEPPEASGRSRGNWVAMTTPSPKARPSRISGMRNGDSTTRHA